MAFFSRARRMIIEYFAEDKTKSASQSAKKNMGLVEGAAKSLGGVLGTIGFGLAVKELVDSSLSLQKIEGRFRAVTGSAAGTANEMAFIRKEADRLGLELESAAGGYSKLAAATKGTSLEGQKTKDIFLSVAEASQVLKLSADETEGALRAIEQISSKGSVQAEELRGQLGERLPGAFQIAARSMGVTTQELNKMLELGQVTAEEFLPLFAAELRRTFSAELPNATQTAQANINRFKNTVFELKTEIAGGAFMTGFTNTLDVLSKKLRDKGFVDGLEGIAEGFNELVIESGGLELALDGILAIFKSLTVGALTLKFVVEQAGTSLGALAAAASLVWEGEFSQAKQVLVEFTDDAEGELERLAARIEKINVFGFLEDQPGPPKPKVFQAPVIPEKSTVSLFDEAKAKADLEKQKKALAKSLENIEDFLTNEDDKLFNKTVERADKLIAFLNAGLISQDRYEALSALNDEFYAKEIDKDEQRHIEKLQRIVDQAKTEDDLVFEQTVEREEALIEALQRKLITEDEYRLYSLNNEQEYQEKLAKLEGEAAVKRLKFEKKTLLEKTRFTFSELSKLTSGVANTNKVMFNLNKAARLSEAAMETVAGVKKTYDSYTYPFNIVMAGAHLLGSLSYMSSLAGASFGGTTAAPVSAGAAAVPSRQDVMNTVLSTTQEPEARAARPIEIRIYNEGAFISDNDDLIRRLEPSIDKLTTDVGAA